MSLKRREIQDVNRQQADPTAKRSEILVHLDALRAEQEQAEAENSDKENKEEGVDNKESLKEANTE